MLCVEICVNSIQVFHFFFFCFLNKVEKRGSLFFFDQLDSRSPSELSEK